MITIRLFARLAEELGTRETTIALPQPATVAGARQALVTDGGSDWARLLGEENIVTALNQEVVDDDAALGDGDELAFFPPVTGG